MFYDKLFLVMFLFVLLYIKILSPSVFMSGINHLKAKQNPKENKENDLFT